MVAALEEVLVGASVIVVGTSVVVVDDDGVDDDFDKASVVKRNTKAMIPANIQV